MQPISRRAILAALAPSPPVRILEPEGEARRYWTRWRGPTGQGVAEGSYPDRWSASHNVRWKVPVPGKGNSSPVIWRDRIFLTTSVAVEGRAARRLLIASGAMMAGCSGSTPRRRRPEKSCTGRTPTPRRRRPPMGNASMPGSAMPD